MFLTELLRVSWEMLAVTGYASVWRTTTGKTDDYRPVVALVRSLPDELTSEQARTLLRADAPRLALPSGSELTHQWGMFTYYPRLGLARYLVEVAGESFTTAKGRVITPGPENVLLALSALAEAVRVDPARRDWLFYPELFLAEVAEKYDGVSLVHALAQRELDAGYNHDWDTAHESPESVVNAWLKLGDVVRKFGFCPLWERIWAGETFTPPVLSWTQFT